MRQRRWVVHFFYFGRLWEEGERGRGGQGPAKVLEVEDVLQRSRQGPRTQKSQGPTSPQVPVETAGSKAMSGFFQHGSSGKMVTLMEKLLALWDLSVYMPWKAGLQRPRRLTGGQRGH